jgi:hypothetical protein
LGLGSELFVVIGWFLVVVCGLGLLITLLFGTFWADRRATPGTVAQREQRLL